MIIWLRGPTPRLAPDAPGISRRGTSLGSLVSSVSIASTLRAGDHDRLVGGTLPVRAASSFTSPLQQSLLTQIGGRFGAAGGGGGGVLSAPATRGSVSVAGSRGAAQPAVLVVESPTKAKKIQGFLGDSYKVLASYGHVRDLPSRVGSVRPDEDFALDWQLLPAARPRLEEIADAATGAPLLLLATDPDREGEAISWHIEQELRRRGVLKRVGAVQRITFTEITRTAITSALSGGRQVSQSLVDAYLARRALDYLVGFHLSPVLWRKLPGAKSAGRVQSVALRLVCEREAALERFTPTAYWTIAAQLLPRTRGADNPPVTARLTHADGRRLGPSDIRSGEVAEELAARIRSGPVAVTRVTRRQVQRHPSAPFTTSSLQQEASRRLGFGAAKTMRVAQQLYEGAGTGEGLITYMRTDGVALSAEAVEDLRRTNQMMYGKDAVPPQPRQYKGRAKNAQEAHEAIRPTRPSVITPMTLPASLDADQRALYGLIWRRAAASQMSSAVYDLTTVEFSADGGALTLRASGSTAREMGFLMAYDDLPPSANSDEEPEREQEQGEEGARGGVASEDEGALALVPEYSGLAVAELRGLQEGEAVTAGPVLPSQHWTRPPPRYTEASLVRALEERGIGRPSTYAPILSLLQDRGYVAREGRSLLPTSLGRVLTAFLEHYFPKYVDYDFTSDMEGQLDEVAAGRAAWRAVLGTFWTPFNAAVAAMGAVRTAQVYDMLDATLESYFFHSAGAESAKLLPPPADGTSGAGSGIDVINVQVLPAPSSAATVAEASGATATAAATTASAAAAVADPRRCPKCGRGRLVLKPSRYGGFIGCSLFADPEVGCDFTRPLLKVEMDSAGTAGGSLSGSERGAASDAEGAGGFGATPANATERLLGSHPETHEPVWVRLGPYGLYVQLGDAPPKAAKSAAGKTKSAGGRRSKKAAGAHAAEADAVEAAAAAEAASPTAAKPKRAAIPKAKGMTLQSVTLEAALALLALPRTLGAHPEDGQPVVANTGPFGPYVAHNGLSASLGRAVSPQTVDLDTAVQLLAAKRARQAAREAKGLPPTPMRGRRRTAAAAGASKPGKGAAASGVKGGEAVAASPKAKAKPKVQASKKITAGPTAAKSAYTMFLQQRWQEIKAAEGGQVPYREAVSRIAAEWRALGEEGQRRFGETAAAAVAAAPTSESAAVAAAGPRSRAARPAPAGAAVLSKASATAAAASRAAKTAVLAEAPAPRPNPYIRFCQERRPALRAAHPGAGLGEISRMLGAEWGMLSDAQRDAYR